MNTLYDFLQTDAQISVALEYFINAPIITIDTETNGLDPHTNRVLLIQMSIGNYTVIIDMTTSNSLAQRDMDSKVWRMMVAILTSSALKIGHNIGFDFKMLRAWFGCDMTNMYCTMLAERMLTSGKVVESKYPSLKSIVPIYTSLTEADMKKQIREDFYKGYVMDGFSKDQLDYSARDVQVLHPIYWKQMHLLQQEGLMRVAGLEFSVIAPMSLMEYYGVNINVPHWRKVLEDIGRERVEVRAKVQQHLQPLVKQRSVFDNFCSISIDSPAQLVTALQKLGIVVESTGKGVLDKLKGDHPIIPLLLEYRKYNRLITAYGEELLAKINPTTGRLHCNFKQIGADSGRASSNNPNLQNIPGDSKFRHGFIAPDGYVCIAADYSQQELRCIGALSRETHMIEAYRRGEDIHSQATAGIYGIPLKIIEETLASIDIKQREGRYSEITPEEEAIKKKRGIAKSCNFLLSYGGSYIRLAMVAGIPEEEAKHAVNTYFNLYPKVKRYIDVEGARAVQQGYSETLSGRKRYYTLPPTTDPDYRKIEAAIKRQGVNHGIQGVCADITKQAMVYIHKDACARFGNGNAYLWGSVHDELLVFAKQQIATEVEQMVVKNMEKAFYDFIPEEVCPIKVDSKRGPMWLH